ncbi:TPA: hypothetical protein ACH3X3_003320 [Trebouxia sp. C0006]
MRQLHYNYAGANLTRQALGGVARGHLSQPSSTPSGAEAARVGQPSLRAAAVGATAVERPFARDPLRVDAPAPRQPVEGRRQSVTVPASCKRKRPEAADPPDDPHDHHKTAGPSSRQLRSFGVQLTSHVERRELDRALIHAFPTEKRQLCAKGKLHLGMARRNRACFSTGSTPAGVGSPDEHAGGARDR